MKKIQFFLICINWLKNRTFLLWLLSFIILVSCENRADHTSLDMLLLKLKIVPNKDISAIIIQTHLGCHSCSEAVSEYIRKNYGNNKIVFIVPFTTSKEMKLEYSSKVLGSSQVFIDKENDAVKMGIVYENSIIIYLEQGRIKEKVILKPENIINEFGKLNIVTSN